MIVSFFIQENLMIKSFAPVIDETTEVLIIGTMPGVKSLQMAQYYAHPYNAFWKIIAELFNNGQPFSNYQEKQQCLLKHHLGLWDSLQLCQREGSLDSDICEEQPNDFAKLLKEYPSVRFLLFNGQAAFKFFKKYHCPILEKMSFHILPSTSPANASITYSDKLNAWKQQLAMNNIVFNRFG